MFIFYCSVGIGNGFSSKNWGFWTRRLLGNLGTRKNCGRLFFLSSCLGCPAISGSLNPIKIPGTVAHNRFVLLFYCYTKQYGSSKPSFSENGVGFISQLTQKYRKKEGKISKIAAIQRLINLEEIMWDKKWKFVIQAWNLGLSLLAFLVLTLPLGMRPGLPETIAGCIFVLGAAGDFILLITRKSADATKAKWLGAMMMFSFLLNVIAAGILFFPLLRDAILAVQIAAAIALIDTIFESVELIKL